MARPRTRMRTRAAQELRSVQQRQRAGPCACWLKARRVVDRTNDLKRHPAP